MPIKKQEINIEKNGANTGRNKSERDMAIADANERIGRLRYSIRIFETRKKAGDHRTPQHGIRAAPSGADILGRSCDQAQQWRHQGAAIAKYL
jgi:hypothetical protein